MITFDTEVISVIQRMPNVKSFRFKTEKEADFKAGQYFFVTIKVGEDERTKHFSFSNSPTEKDYIEFTKRITDSPYSKALDKMEVGDWARLRLPYGSFTFEGGYEKLAFLSGGIGITPLRSICKHVADKKLPADIILLYGNSTEEDIIFRRDFDQMQSLNNNIKAVYTLTSPEIDKDWRGKTGYIDSKMIAEEIPDFAKRVFYICGPPLMVKKLVDILKNDLVIAEDRIRLENFAGY